MSIHDESSSHRSISDWNSPYTPGTPLGDSARWYEPRKIEPLIEPAGKPYTGKLPVRQMALTFILGVWGAILLALIL